MATQNEEKPVEIEEKAKIIGSKLQKLQAKCANHTEKVKDTLCIQIKRISSVSLKSISFYKCQ